MTAEFKTSQPRSKPKQTPDWESWNKRYSISIFDAICTVHNILANKEVLEELKELGDKRTSKFSNHIKTLKDAVRNDPSKLPIAIGSEGKPVTTRTHIYLVPFIRWVRTTSPFGDNRNIPSNFFALKPPRVKTQSSADISSSSQPNDRLVDSDLWAKLLITLLMCDYGLFPMTTKELSDPSNEGPLKGNKGKAAVGVYAPIAKLCHALKIRRLTTPLSVQRKITSAMLTFSDKEIDELKQKLSTPAVQALVKGRNIENAR